MLYDLLGECGLKITLSAVEICDYFGSFEELRYDNENARAALGCILKQAVCETDFSLSGERLFIKVRPTEQGGCTICFTVTERKKRKLRPSYRTYIYEFCGCENMLLACEQIKRLSHTDTPLCIYRRGDTYRLLIEEKHVNRAILALGPEFSQRVLTTHKDSEKTKEHWCAVCTNTPVSKIIGF